VATGLSAVTARGGTVGLRECCENGVLPIFRDSNPGVPDLEVQNKSGVGFHLDLRYRRAEKIRALRRK